MNKDFFKVVTAPATEPITNTEVKEFARIDTSTEDDLLDSWITSIRQATEMYLGRSLITQTLDYFFDYWPESGILSIPRPPLISISSIISIDEDGTEETISSDTYYVVSEDIPGKVVLKNNFTGLTLTPRSTAGYKARYTAGYGADADDVPSAIKNGMKQWVTYVYETRNFSPEPPPEALGFLSFFKVIDV